jgi:hypothetical protein
MITEKMYAELDHATRGPMTVLLGEIELVLSDTDVPAEKRRQSQGSVVEVVPKMEQMLVQWRDGGSRR